YVLVREVPVPLDVAGANRFEAVFEPAEPGQDGISANNRAETVTLVHGAGRILVLDGVGGEAGAILPRALMERGMNVERMTAPQMPANLAQLQRYDAVVLQNVGSYEITPAQQAMLARYVNELGGGLAMIGGPASFGAGGWAHTPVDRVLPVESEAPSRRVMPAGALAIVIDRSGSMGSHVTGTGHVRQELANEAAVLALQSLYPQDMIGVVAFDTSARWVVEMQSIDDAQAIAGRIRSIEPGGGTHIYPGIASAYEALAELGPEQASVRHIIVLTDGMDNPQLRSNYPGLIQDITAAGMTLTTVGVGEAGQIDSDLLQWIAASAGGNFYHVTDAGELPQIFIKEAQTVRTTLVREQTFEPQLRATGSPIMRQLGAVPPLHGLVVTGEKRDSRVFTPILGPEGEPVFAHWQVGLGRAAAFTSDATSRWGRDWVQWSGYDDFWATTMRMVARPAEGRELDLVAEVRGRELRVRLDSGADGAGPAGGVQRVRGTVLTPDGGTTTIELEQTAPGVYVAAAPASREGSYLVSLFVQRPGAEPRTAFAAASRPPAAELRQFASNERLLRQVAEITGGRVFDPTQAEPPEHGLFTRTYEFESQSLRPLWRTLLPALLVLFFLDAASRRVAWDAPAIWAWARRRAAAARALMQGKGERTEATLAALRQRRASAAAQRIEAPPAATAPSAPRADDAARPSRRVKFDARPGGAPAGDIGKALGGASGAGDGGGEAGDAERATEAQEEEQTTSRLLAAKRRARERSGGGQA
ncbi:MAG: glutamine amidotransferase, partial [Phycisphaeraceae bacterium]